MNELEQLQKELADLRRKSEKRSFKQVMKDGHNKVCSIIRDGPNCVKMEDFVIAMFVVVVLILSAAASLLIFTFITIYTNGSILLLLSIYPLYLIFRKEQ